MADYCCSDMQAHVQTVMNHTIQLDCHGGTVISYIPKFNEYGISCCDGHSHIEIRYCPWCGKALLPASLRERWVNDLLDMGYEDPLFDDTIPQKYKNDSWWRDGVKSI